MDLPLNDHTKVRKLVRKYTIFHDNTITKMFKKLIEKIVNDVLKGFLETYKVAVAQKMYDKIAKAIDDLPLGDALESQMKRILEQILEDIIGADVATEFDIKGIETAEGEGEEEDPMVD